MFEGIIHEVFDTNEMPKEDRQVEITEKSSLLTKFGSSIQTLVVTLSPKKI